MRLPLIALSLTCVAALTASAAARQAPAAQLALEAARKTEVVDRNILAAILQYRDVATRYESDGTVAPTALLKLAGCYEQLGQPEARATYERIVKYYPDSAPAQTARVKLAGAQREAGVTTEQWWTYHHTEGAPSADGRYFTFIDHASGLSVRNVKSGSSRRVPLPATSSGLAANSAPSPDGRLIAYIWWAERPELRVINAAGGQPTVVCCDEPGAGIELFGWSNDGKAILFAMLTWSGAAQTTRLAIVAATGGPPRVLKALNGSVTRAGLSPDGQFIVYDAPRASDTRDRGLFIMRTDGSAATPLIAHSANDQMLDWFPDGKRVLFVSDRA